MTPLLYSVEPAHSTPTADSRHCVRCFEEKPYTREHWPSTRGKAIGSVCRVCARARKRNYDAGYKAAHIKARADNATSLSLTPSSNTGVSARDKAPGELPFKQLEIVKALREGAQALNAYAASILNRIFGYAADPASPHHEWALRLIAERIIPRKLYEDLGGQAAGIKTGAGALRPAVTIIVQPATTVTAEPAVHTVEGERLP